jgi:hypothetical protein
MINKEQIDVNTDILRVNGSLYAIKRIECDDIDINEELKDLYGKKHEQHVETLNEGIVENASEDWNKQIEHIQNFGNKGTYTVPASLYNKPVMVFKDNLIELRMITYAPNKVRVSRSYLQSNYAWLCGRDDVHDLIADDTNDGRFIVHIEPPFSFPMLVGYSKKLNKLYTPNQRTYHTFSDGTVCTSNHKASEFWALDPIAMEREMNIINTFSPANREVNGVRMLDLITENSFVSVARREEGVWNV